MSITGKPLDEITASDLASFIEHEVAENRSLEFKRDLPGGRDEDKREFLADATSFANAGGGDLIYGIAEETGVAAEIVGVEATELDANLLRLDSLMRDGVAPRISGIRMKPVPVGAGRICLIVRIAQSFNAPHMVIFKNASRFYSRTSAGKYQLDVDELRAAFVGSERWAERLRGFRADRLAQIVAGQTPVPLVDGARIVLHVVPVRALTPGSHVGLDPIMEIHRGRLIQAMGGFGGGHHRINIDGFLRYAGPGKHEPVDRYVQLYRNGAVELVDRFLVRFREDHLREVLPSSSLEEYLIVATDALLAIQRDSEVSAPIAIMVTLLGVRGRRFALANDLGTLSEPIDRDAIVIPDLVIDSLSAPTGNILRPVLDMMWNAVGHERSPNYAVDGSYHRSPRRDW